MKFKYEIMQILLMIAALVHIILGVVVIALVIEDSLDTTIDAIVIVSWISIALLMSVANNKLDDKIKETKINNLNKQMRK